MSKGRRKVKPDADAGGVAAAALPAPAVAPRKVARPATRRWFGLHPAVVGAIAVVAGAAIWLVARWAWPSSIEVREPIGIHQAAPEVRDYVLSRVAAAKADPKNAARQSDLGIALAANGFWAESRHSFEAAARLDPKDPLPAYYAAIADIESGRAEIARAELVELAKKFPTFAPVPDRLGRMLLDLGEIDAAAAQFKRVMEIEGERSVWGALGLGKALLRQGNAAQAADVLQALVQREPSMPEARFLLGSAYLALKKPDRARDQLAAGIHPKVMRMPDAWSERIESEARHVQGRVGRAQRLMDAGRAAEAIAILEAARRTNPDHIDLLSNLGAAYLNTNQVQQARDVLVHAEEVNPSNVPTIYNLVELEDRLGRLENALRYANRALTLAPGHYHSHLLHAGILEKMNRPSEALAALQRAVKIEPRNAYLRRRTAQLLIRMQRLSEARDEAVSATGIDPLSVEGWIMLAELCIALNLAGDAKNALEQLRLLAPQAKDLASLEQRIQRMGGR